MRSLLAATCLTPVALASFIGLAHAETVIGNSVTTSQKTSIANAGTADDIRISSAGTVKPAAGTAVMIDSNNGVTNEGTIQITDANDAIGILANPGFSGAINNSGKITIDETYTATDTDKDGDLDGRHALGENRFGIRVAPGGTFTGSITNSGSITVEGNNSAGILVGSALKGSLSNTSGISVIGDNSFGVRAGEISGDVNLSGAITAQGENAVGVALNGDIGGKLVIQGVIGSTGYRSTTVPDDTSKLDADDLLQGGPALRVSGNVAGGIVFDVPPTDSDPKNDDEDNDGIKDANEGSASVSSYGAAPAVQIGSASEDITIGAVAGSTSGHGILVKGSITGSGLYKDVDANGLVIGGQGGAVNVAGGLTVSGSVSATSSGGNATAVRIGNGATLDTINVNGKVEATGGSAAASNVGAIVIDQGANVAKITNSGTISANRTGTDGTAYAIVDRSGSVNLIENTGGIGIVGDAANTDKGIAIDLSANTSGATIRQTVLEKGSPAIAGNILLGSGNDVLDIQDGTVKGNIQFGAGANTMLLSGDAASTGNVAFGGGNDQMTLSGTAAHSGAVDFGGGTDQLHLFDTSSFTGTLAGASGLGINVAGGTLGVINTAPVAIGSLNVGAQGAVAVTVDGTTGTATRFDVAGNANFADGAKILVSLTGLNSAEGSYDIIRAGTLTGASGLTNSDVNLPYLFASALSADEAVGNVSLTIRRKNATELGLNRSEAAAYDAVYAALSADKPLGDVFLGLRDQGSFKGTLRQMLPDHAGGVFEAVTQGSRAVARLLADPNAPFKAEDGWGFWLQQVAWGTSKNLGDTAAYDINGWGMSGGAEIVTGVGNFGLSIAYLNGKDSDGETQNEMIANQYEAAAYWRGNWGGFRGYARAAAAYVDLEGSRFFVGSNAAGPVSRTAGSDHSGTLYSAAGGVSYQLQTGRLTLRPGVSLDYYRLAEKGYTETGGGTGFNLTVDKRTSDEFAASGTVAVGYDLMKPDPDRGWFRVEVEGGRRQLIGGTLGATTARFSAGGNAFTLIAEERESGWIGAIRAMGGNSGFRVGGEVNAEEQQGRAAVAFRASLQIGL